MFLTDPFVNIDTSTWFSYGVVDAINCPKLLERIKREGNNILFDTVASKIYRNLTKLKTLEDINAYLKFQDCLISMTEKEFKLRNNKKFLKAFARRALESCPFFDDYHYVYSKKHEEYEAKPYKDTALILIKKSPFIAACLRWGPEIPNAGDLNQITSKENRDVIAYCFSPHEYEGPEKFNVSVFRKHVLLSIE